MKSPNALLESICFFQLIRSPRSLPAALPGRHGEAASIDQQRRDSNPLVAAAFAFGSRASEGGGTMSTPLGLATTLLLIAPRRLSVERSDSRKRQLAGRLRQIDDADSPSDLKQDAHFTFN